MIALIDRYIDTVKSDKNDLIDGIQQLLNSTKDGNKNAKDLIDRFGKMPAIIFSGAKNYDNSFKVGNYVKIINSTNPYHDNGDIEPIWSINEESRTLVCPDASGGSVPYSFDDVEPT